MAPTDAIVAVTWKCNCRCRSCNIWRIPGAEARELAPGDYARLPSTLRDINITGGEPFLRNDIEELILSVHQTCPRAHIIVSTNGLLTRPIRQAVRRLMEKVPRFGVAVSIDGIGEMHDRMRGVAGAYENAQQTAYLLARDGLKDLRLAFTASADNVSHLSRVYDLARELGVEFTCAVAHPSSHYFHTTEAGLTIPPGELREQVEYVIARELSGLSPKRWARAFFLDAMADFNARLGRPFPCRAGLDTMFLSPEGDLYPCNALDARMGNIQEGRFADVWRSPDAAAARARVARCRNGCWMVCSARTVMKRHWPTVLLWCVRRKLRGGKR